MWLALDTSCLTLSLALVRPTGALVEQVFIAPPAKQSDALPGAVDELLRRHGLTVSALTGLFSGLGPGSFTGLRIGLSCLKGLAWAAKIPLVGASSLAALALEGPESTELLPVAVVKKNELYVGRYRHRDGQLETLEPERSTTVEAFAAFVKERPDARICGPALSEYRSVLEGLGVASERLLPAPLVPSAFRLTQLVGLPDSWDARAVFALEPHYLRGSGAEENPKFPPLPGVESKARLLTPRES